MQLKYNPQRLLLILMLLASCLVTKAQNLVTEFENIGANNDMMGGSLVVFCENGILESLAIGKSDFYRDIDMTEDSKYRIASISKTITAIGVMQLEEQGLLDLDDDISTILGYDVENPNFPSSPITVRMLLSHTSSIIDGPTYNAFLSATINNNPIPNLSEILTPGGAFYSSTQFNNIEPGTYFNYSNINYVILGTLIEKVSQVRFDVYCKENISDPLQIDASFNVNDLNDINEVAVIYRKPGGIWTAQVDDYMGIQPIHTNIADYIPGTNGGRFGPQGGYRCSAKDLAKIFLVLMNQGSFDGATLLTPESCDAMLANEWTYDGSNGNNLGGLFLSWGLGIHRITSTPGSDIVLPGSSNMYGHAGEAYGLVSDAFFDFDRKVGIVYLTNGVGIGYQTNGNSAFYTIEQEVFEAIETEGNIDECLTILGNGDDAMIDPSIYPNPTNSVINIPSCNRPEGCEINILSADGKSIGFRRIANGTSAINVKELSAGIYFIHYNGRTYRLLKN